jgi:RHS repeat-associated protein
VTLAYGYDNLDNVTSISRNAIALVTYAAFAGSAWGSRTVELGGAWATTIVSIADRDGLGRRVYGITHTGTRGASTSFTEALGYTRDLVGDPTPVARTGNYLLPNETITYAYDTLHRVSDASYPADSTTEDINLDVLGNRLTYTGRSGPQITYTHNLVNEYTSLTNQLTAPVHDANGNLATNDRGFIFEYDYENRLTGVRAPDGTLLSAYTYDATGRRTSEARTDALATVTTLYFHDGRNVAVEYNASSPNTPLRYYVNGGTYIDERVLLRDCSAGKDFAYTINDTYGVTGLVDNLAKFIRSYRYDVYGRTTEVKGWPTGFDHDADVDLGDFGVFNACYNGPNRPPAQANCERCDFDRDGDVDLGDFGVFNACYNGPNRPPACGSGPALASNPFAFTGQRADSLNSGNLLLYDCKVRVYDPRHGRFQQHDGTEIADSYNLYEYVRSRPTVFADPSGRQLVQTVSVSTIQAALTATIVATAITGPAFIIHEQITNYSFSRNLVAAAGTLIAEGREALGEAVLRLAGVVMSSSKGRKDALKQIEGYRRELRSISPHSSVSAPQRVDLPKTPIPFCVNSRLGLAESKRTSTVWGRKLQRNGLRRSRTGQGE